MVMENNAKTSMIFSEYIIWFAPRIDIFNRKPNKTPPKVVKIALSFNTVS